MTSCANAGGAVLESAIRNAAEQGRPALAAFLTAGYPSPGRYEEALGPVSKAADILEVGVPFSDPMADGVTIQRSSRVALEQGIDLDGILATLRRRAPSATVVLMSYLNPLLAHGVDRLAREAPDAGVCGFIVPDLPLEESKELRELLDRRGLALVQMVAPSTPPERLERVCRASRGFVYAVSFNGVTGGEISFSDVGDYLDRVREVSPLPVLAGFGIREADQVESLRPHCDGVVVGTALIEVVEREEDPREFLRGLIVERDVERGARP